MILIASHEPNWPALDWAAFLIERACVPRYVPRFCAETAQFFAAMEEALRRNSPQENASDS